MNQVHRSDSGSVLPPVAILFTVLLVAAVLLCLSIEWIYRVFLHATLPLYIYPLRVEEVRFPDLMAFYPRFSLLHTEAFFTSTATNHFMYPAAAVPVYMSFYAGAPHIPATYLGFSLGVLLMAGLLVVDALMRRGVGTVAAMSYVFITMLCAYPIWFALSQANIEVVIWVLIASAIAFLWSGRGYPACVCFGLAAAIKIYPALFLTLPLFRKQWKQAALGAAVAVLYSTGSLLYVGPTVAEASRGIAAGLNRFRSDFMLCIRDVTGIDHSLFSLYKLLFKNHVAAGRFETALPLYLGLMTATVLLLLFIRVRRLPLANQIAFCVVVCVLLPPTSFEYTLLHIMTLYALFSFLLLDARRAGLKIPGLTTALACCSACLGFMPEFIHHGLQVDGILKCFALIALLLTVLRYPFPKTSDESETRSTSVPVASAS